MQLKFLIYYLNFCIQFLHDFNAHTRTYIYIYLSTDGDILPWTEINEVQPRKNMVVLEQKTVMKAKLKY